MEPPEELLEPIRIDPIPMALAISCSVFALRCMEEFRGNAMEEADTDDALATVQLSCLLASRACRLSGGDELLTPAGLAHILQACNMLFTVLLRQTTPPVSETDLAGSREFLAKLASDEKNSPGLVSLKKGIDSTLPMIAADPAPIKDHEGGLARMNSFAVQMRTLLQIGELNLRTLH